MVIFLEELADAFRSRTDVHFGIYFSLFEWFHPFFLYDQQNKFKTRLYPEVIYNEIFTKVHFTEAFLRPFAVEPCS